jgi:hypothetical protein
MLLGITNIYAKINSADECGLYRTSDTGNGFFLFSFNDKSEALLIGSKLATMLGVKFINKIVDLGTNKVKPVFGVSTLDEINSKKLVKNDTSDKIKIRKQQVRGMDKLVKSMIGQYTHSEIINKLMTKYIDVGYSMDEAKKKIKWYIRDVTK